MFQRHLALCLACTALLATPVSAARVTDGSGLAQSVTGNTSVTMPTDGTISFEGIRARVQTNNRSLKAAEENLKSAQAMNWDEPIGELQDAIDEMEDQLELLLNSTTGSLEMAQQQLAAAIGNIKVAGDKIIGLQEFANSLILVNTLNTASQLSKMQAASLEASLESMETQLEDLKEQKEDYQKTLEDTEHQIDYAADQTVSGAESLYLTILSTNLQRESLLETLESTKRSLDEVQLRYDLGQVSQLTLLQAQNGYQSVETSLASLENTLSSLTGSLQTLMGDPATGQLTLTNIPSVTEQQLSALSYATGLTRAKERSYTLYASTRAVENAEEEMNDARRDEGKDSYQYKMAAYAYQAALYQDQATVAEFELAFQNLYKAIPPAQAALTDKEAALDYEEQVYAVAEKKHALGLLSNNALLDAQVTLHSAQREVQAAKLDLFTAYHNYNQAVQKGLVNSGG